MKGTSANVFLKCTVFSKGSLNHWLCFSRSMHFWFALFKRLRNTFIILSLWWCPNLSSPHHVKRGSEKQGYFPNSRSGFWHNQEDFMQSGVSASRPNETPLRPPHVHTHTYLLKSHFRKNTPNLWKLGSESKSQVRYLQIDQSFPFCSLRIDHYIKSFTATLLS